MTSAMGLTKRQTEMLAYLQVAMRDNRPAPSFDEMLHDLEYTSKSNIHGVLVRLEERGRIRRIPGRARAIEIISPLQGCDVRKGSGRQDLSDALRRAADRIDAKTKKDPSGAAR